MDGEALFYLKDRMREEGNRSFHTLTLNPVEYINSQNNLISILITYDQDMIHIPSLKYSNYIYLSMNLGKRFTLSCIDIFYVKEV